MVRSDMPKKEHQQRYRVIDKIAAGGMAEVFRAESAGIEGFKKRVAIKRVLPHLSKKPQFISMFLDEARLCAQLNHSNVVQTFDIGMGDDTYFIVMEYVDGADLKAIIERLRKAGYPVPLVPAVYIALKICEGLSYAHGLADSRGKPFGIVHRDVSPPNVLITRYGEVKITDFGLARANNQLEHSEPGIIKGKFSYLAPEAALGLEVDSRVDIFAVGIILWEMLAGRKLFSGASDYETVKQVQQAQIPSLRGFNEQVPDALETVILKALARDPEQRYQRASQLAKDLNAFLFECGKPVGPWDIAHLVRETVADRKRQQPAGANIIDELIKQALFEFTSLGVQDPSVSTSRSTPTGSFLSMEDGSVPDWASEIQIHHPFATTKSTDRREQLLSRLDGFEMGNLSALEDVPSSRMGSIRSTDAARKVEKSVDKKSQTVPSAAAGDQGASAGLARRPDDGLEAPRAKSSHTMMVIALIVLAVGIGCLAAALVVLTK